MTNLNTPASMSIILLVQISHTDIGFQDVYNMEDLMKMDFPPKIEMSLLSIPKMINSDPLSLCVEGLSKEVIFTLNPGKLVHNLLQEVSYVLVFFGRNVFNF